MVTMGKIILLKRDSEDETIVAKLGVEETLHFMVARNFRNSHQLVRDERKMALRAGFFP